MADRSAAVSASRARTAISVRPMAKLPPWPSPRMAIHNQTLASGAKMQPATPIITSAITPALTAR